MSTIKKGIVWGILIVFMISLTSGAMAFKSKSNYDFYQNRVLGLAYDKKTYVRLQDGGVIFCSDDFKSWSCMGKLDQACGLVYFNNKFIAMGAKNTFTSSDGRTWEKHQNNIECYPLSIAQNSQSIMLSSEAGTFASNDGITFQKIENVPPGVKIRVVNDMFALESLEYMAGIYVSKDGYNFSRLNVQGFNLTYYGGKYHTMQYGENVRVHYTSYDLENWTKTQESYDVIYPQNCVVINNNDQECAYSIDGQYFILKNGAWAEMPSPVYQNKQAFLFFNFYDGGLLAYNEVSMCYATDDYVNFKSCEYPSDKIQAINSNQQYFYLKTSHNKVLKSQNGIDWQIEQYDVKPEALSLYASNGEIMLKSDYIDYQSRAGYSQNPDITAQITDKDAEQKTVVYENAKYGYIEVYGGSGFFIIKSGTDVYISYDGITRYLVPIKDAQSVYLNNTTLLYIDSCKALTSVTLDEIKALGAGSVPVIKLNGEYLSFESPPVIENERTLVSLRFLFERAGASVAWDDAEKSIEITKGDTKIRLFIDSDTAYVNGEKIKLDAVPKILNNKTYLPLRFVCEALGLNVTWDSGFIKLS